MAKQLEATSKTKRLILCAFVGIVGWLCGAVLGGERDETEIYPENSKIARTFEKAMDADLSFGKNENKNRTDSIDAWKEVLVLEEASKEHKFYAAWRLAALYAYRYDASLGEKPNMQEAEKYLSMARDLLPDTITYETANAATLYASLPGEPMERVRRLVKVYTWFRTRTPEMISTSANCVNSNGRLISISAYRTGKKLPSVSLEEKMELLTVIMDSGRQLVSQNITDFIKYTQDAWARDALKEALEETADPLDKTTWQATSGVFESDHTLSELDNVENSLSVVARNTPEDISDQYSTESNGTASADSSSIPTLEDTAKPMQLASRPLFLIFCSAFLGIAVIGGFWRYKRRVARAS